MGSQHKPYSHHGYYLAVKVSNILKKAHGRKFEKERIKFIDFTIIIPSEISIAAESKQTVPDQTAPPRSSLI